MADAGGEEVSRRGSISVYWAAAIALLAYSLACLAGERSVDQTVALPASAHATKIGRAGDTTIADVAEKSVASVVNLSSEKVVRGPVGDPFGPFFGDPLFRHFFDEGFFFPGIPRERRELSLGSGVVVREDGIVLTNHHVVERAEDIRVTLADGREYEAEILGTDPPTDLALLRLEGDTGRLEPLPFGDSDRLRLGDVVLAIGNPFGVGQTVTMGIVSAKGRSNMGIVDYEDFIQTDAAINPGNSGGALIDTEGKLVGINTAIITRSGGYQGIGFAIPSNMARSVMESLLDEGRVVRGWLGVVIQEITSDLAAALGLEGVQGVLVSDVAPDSPAARAGLERGDVILRFDGEPVDRTGQLRNRVAAAGEGAEVKLHVLRDDDELSIAASLGELPTEVVEPPEGAPPAGATPGGLALAPLDETARRHLRVPDHVEGGVVVRRISPRSPALRAGLRRGDVIREVDRQPVHSVAEFRQRYETAGDPVLLLVQRGTSVLFLPLRKAR
jgi:serine protease Do